MTCDDGLKLIPGAGGLLGCGQSVLASLEAHRVHRRKAATQRKIRLLLPRESLKLTEPAWPRLINSPVSGLPRMHTYVQLSELSMKNIPHSGIHVLADSIKKLRALL